MIDIGNSAPDFTLTRDGGGEITLSSLRPKAVVLYFYPKDDTPGCTLEAQDFTQMRAQFEAAGAVVMGVSKDAVISHDKFRDKYALQVALLADTQGAVCEAYGTWVEKMNFGKKYMGIERTTYLIDGAGNVAHIWKKVRTKGHAAAVLERVKDL